MCLVPASSFGHETGALGTVEEHIEEDSVSQAPVEERRLQRQSDMATQRDAKAAQIESAGNPSVVGEWGPSADWPVVGIHVALMPNGTVLAYDSNGDYPNDDQSYTRATIWDPKTDRHTAVNPNTGINVFCSGLAHLMDGRLYVAGGNESTATGDGIKATHVFDGETKTWEREGDMATERWYPSVTPLRDGEMLITEGDDLDHPHIPEVRDTDGNIRELTSAEWLLPLYPWIDVAPDGRAFVSGPDRILRSLDPSGTGAWSSFQEYYAVRDSEYRSYGSHALYDIGKILIAGGGDEVDPGDGGPDTTSDSAVVIDLNGDTPQTSPTQSMENRRRQHNLTVLADGTVLATGGLSTGEPLVDLDHGVYAAELWDPESGQNGEWTTLAAMAKTRQYHSTALLLPDGRVLSSGGGVCGTCRDVGYLEKNAEIFSPPYLFDDSGQPAPRPEINRAPRVVAYNAPFPIRSPDAERIRKVALIRLGAVTHSVNMEQRYVPLDYTLDGTTLAATSPEDSNIAPPGVYMLFVIDDEGVPSESKMVRIDLEGPGLPMAPLGLSTDPESPSNENNPQVKGAAPSGSIVEIFATSDCLGAPLASGSATKFGGAGIPVSVPADKETQLRATATDSVGNTSDCSDAVSYTEDSTSPTAPTISATDPTSPANNNNPKIKGTAEPLSTVKLHSGADCSGAAINGSAATFASPGLTATVTRNATTNFRVTATDAADNVSPCSNPYTYVEDSAAPTTTTTVITLASSATASFDSEPETTFKCRLDAGQFVACSSPTGYPGLAVGLHTFEVRATDRSGNTSHLRSIRNSRSAPLSNRSSSCPRSSFHLRIRPRSCRLWMSPQSSRHQTTTPSTRRPQTRASSASRTAG